jgi:hypothetical protein
MMTSQGAAPRGLVLVILGCLMLALLAWLSMRVTVGGTVRAVADCRQRYDTARSLRDTADVDMTYPASRGGRAGGRGARTCGDLRLAGRLRK